MSWYVNVLQKKTNKGHYQLFTQYVPFVYPNGCIEVNWSDKQKSAVR